MATIRKRGGKYQARIQRLGFPQQSKTFDNRNDAERWARSVERQIDLGAFAPQPASNLRLSDLLARYRTEVTPSKRGSELEAIRLAAMERREIAQCLVSNLSAMDVARYRDARLKSVVGATVNRDLDDLSAVLNHARREWGIKIDNPIQAIRRPSRGRSRTRLLGADEEVHLMEAVSVSARDKGGRFTEATRNPWLKPLIQLAILTAMRRGELLALQWRHVDLEGRIAFLPSTKNGDSRLVPLSTQAVDVLRGLPRAIGQEEVFATSAMALRRAFERACKRAGIEDLHFHDLRHTAATRLSEKLPNVIELAAVTGHRDLKMLQRYYHPRAQDLAKKLG